MTCPVKLPASIEHDYLKDKEGVMIVDMLHADLDEQQYVLKAINHHDRMANAIARFVNAEAACLNSRSTAYAEACAERILAIEALEQIHNELNPKE